MVVLAFQLGVTATAAATASFSWRDCRSAVDDGLGGRISGNATNVRHGRLFGGGNDLFGIRRACIEFVLKRLAARCQPPPPAARASRWRWPALAHAHRPEPFHKPRSAASDWAFHCSASAKSSAMCFCRFVNNSRRRAAMRPVCHQHVEKDEGDAEPEQLRSESLRVERRKAAVPTLRWVTSLVVCAVVAITCSDADKPRSYSANSSNSAISSEKMPSASVIAKPKIRLPNWPCAADGLRSAAAR